MCVCAQVVLLLQSMLQALMLLMLMRNCLVLWGWWPGLLVLALMWLPTELMTVLVTPHEAPARRCVRTAAMQEQDEKQRTRTRLAAEPLEKGGCRGVAYRARAPRCRR